jgi:hypothetical protein
MIKKTQQVWCDRCSKELDEYLPFCLQIDCDKDKRVWHLQFCSECGNVFMSEFEQFLKNHVQPAASGFDSMSEDDKQEVMEKLVALNNSHAQNH